jgi:hypothetical protein
VAQARYKLGEQEVIRGWGARGRAFNSAIFEHS